MHIKTIGGSRKFRWGGVSDNFFFIRGTYFAEGHTDLPQELASPGDLY